jgi:hypothetical protein
VAFPGDLDRGLRVSAGARCADRGRHDPGGGRDAPVERVVLVAFGEAARATLAAAVKEKS